MKSRSSLLGISCCIVIMFVVAACSPKVYVDSNGSTMKIADGYLATYPDSNVFVYKTKVYGTRDTEKVYPKFFEIKLPRNINYFRFSGQGEFEFYYFKNQVVYIKIDLEDKGAKKNIDTTYQPSKAESEYLTNFEKYSDSDTSKYILQKIPFKKNRTTSVLKKGAATILLYNLVPEKHQDYFNLVNQFKFLE